MKITDQEMAEEFSLLVDAMEQRKTRLRQDLAVAPQSLHLKAAIKACDDLVEMARKVLCPRVH